MRSSTVSPAMRVCCLALLGAVALLSARPAKADAILGLQNVNGSPYVNLSSILNGTYKIAAISGGSPSSGSINVTNDVAGGITSLTLYYYGVTGPSNDAGSTLTCHNFNFNGTGGGGQTTCSIFDPNNNTSYANGAKTPNFLPLNTYTYTWNFATAQTGNFNIVWSSFSGTGYTGCIAGTQTCSAVPEPASFGLLCTGLIAVMGLHKKLLR